MGVDEDVRCIIMSRPTKSEMLWVQMIGRGLRTAPGKNHLLILDHAGNAENLGLPDAIHHEHLDTHSPSESVIPPNSHTLKPTKCQSCGYLIPPGVGNCPQCGAARQRRGSEIMPADGELVEYGAKSKKAPKTARERLAARDARVVYRELLAVCKSSGEVAHRFKDIFGCWPQFSDRISILPSDEVCDFVTAQRIRWAKSQKRRAA
jgi:superfamily II DNA or RNA helicase